MTAKTVEFKAEVKQVLDLVIHSLYTHKEVFLRELISNASDSIDKAKFLSLTNKEISKSRGEWKIKITADKDQNILTVTDNGIGMTEEEIIKALGTIAHSGTKEFVELIKSKKLEKNPELIGQFGVGFYSSFMVADDVTVLSKSMSNGKAVKWESKADGTYTIEDVEKSAAGTEIILKLKEDAKEYLDVYTLKNIVKKYSDYIEYPVVIDVEKEKEDKDNKDKKITTIEEETINSMKAIWLKNKEDITEEEYNEFYKHISHDFADPLKRIHYRAEGTQEFSALLYIPTRAPFDMLYKDFKAGPSLYVKKIQIMEHCEDLLPPYLRFVKGVVDSSDLPLNVSRETLQNNRQITLIKNNLGKKVLEALKTLKDKEKEKYIEFFKEFGRVIKEGIHYDYEKKNELAELIIVQSTKTGADKYIDLDEYLKNMKKDQKEIYYIFGKSIPELKISPYLEAFRDKDYEVLYMQDEVDDIIMGSLGEYKGKKIKNIIKGDIDLGTISEEDKKEQEKKFNDIISSIKEHLKDKVKEVKLSGRLKDTICCLVADEQAMDPSMEKMFKAMGQAVPDTKRILEINPAHPLFKKLLELYNIDSKSKVIGEYSGMLYDMALMLEGSEPENKVSFVTKISKLMEKGITS